MKKRLLSMLLACILVISLIPETAFAATLGSAEENQNGSAKAGTEMPALLAAAGEDVGYLDFDENGKLSIVPEFDEYGYVSYRTRFAVPEDGYYQLYRNVPTYENAIDTRYSCSVDTDDEWGEFCGDGVSSYYLDLAAGSEVFITIEIYASDKSNSGGYDEELCFSVDKIELSVAEFGAISIETDGDEWGKTFSIGFDAPYDETYTLYFGISSESPEAAANEIWLDTTDSTHSEREKTAIEIPVRPDTTYYYYAAVYSGSVGRDDPASLVQSTTGSLYSGSDSSPAVTFGTQTVENQTHCKFTAESDGYYRFSVSLESEDAAAVIGILTGDAADWAYTYAPDVDGVWLAAGETVYVLPNVDVYDSPCPDTVSFSIACSASVSAGTGTYFTGLYGCIPVEYEVFPGSSFSIGVEYYTWRQYCGTSGPYTAIAPVTADNSSSSGWLTGSADVCFAFENFRENTLYYRTFVRDNDSGVCYYSSSEAEYYTWDQVPLDPDEYSSAEVLLISSEYEDHSAFRTPEDPSSDIWYLSAAPGNAGYFDLILSGGLISDVAVIEQTADGRTVRRYTCGAESFSRSIYLRADAEYSFVVRAGNIPEQLSAKLTLAENDPMNNIIAYGDCGDNMTWTLSKDGVLTVSGTGEMWSRRSYALWNNSYESAYFSTQIRSAVIESGVTSIGCGAFSGSSGLTDVTIPDTVTRIDDSAFFGCSSLTDVTLPDSLISIGADAFSKCGFTDVVLPDGVRSVGAWAFSECSSLTSITIPDSVTSIGEDLVRGCENLESITLPFIGDGTAANPYFGYVFGKDSRLGVDAFEIPESLKTVNVSDACSTIYAHAFKDCFNLKKVKIGSGVKSIGLDAFEDCSKLTSAEAGDIGAWCGISFASYYSNPLALGHSLYIDGVPAGDIVIPQGTTSIGRYAFYGCSNLTLTGVTIPDSVTSIGDEAFANCFDLERVTIGKGLTSIGDNVFRHCGRLRYVMVDSDNRCFCSDGIGAMFDRNKTRLIHFPNDPSGTGVTSYTIPSSVTAIESSAFSDGYELERLVIPESVTSIGDYAFEGCSRLTGLVIPDSVKSIGSSVFSGCSKLEKLTIGNSVKSIGSGAFEGCSRLTSLVIPDSVTSIGEGSFSECSSLERVTIGNGLTSIYDNAFSGMDALKSVTIGNSVTSIGAGAFSGCGITDIVIPESVTSIGDSAFTVCVDLTNAVILGELTSISKWTFMYCTALKSITIPVSVTSIEYAAFSDCDSLSDVYYDGTGGEWSAISIGDFNEALLTAAKHFSNAPYSRTKIPVFKTTSGTTKKDGVTVEFNGKAGYFGDDAEVSTMTIGWNFDLFKYSAKGYSNDLAIASLVLSANAYDLTRVTDTLHEFGFDEVVPGNYDAYDDIDRVGYTISGTTEKINGELTNVIAIVCRGSTGSFLVSEDWKSNIIHQSSGFLEAAGNVKDGFDEFVSSENVNTSLPTKILITGHSRGAAVANFLGRMMSDVYGKDNVYAYTFACPTTTSDENRFSYTNIKNIINADDAVPAVPGWLNGHILGSNRYGLECSFKKDSVSGYASAFSAVAGLNTYDVSNPIMEHSPVVYMAYLLSIHDIGVNSKYCPKVISVKCPVDVFVYDRDNDLLGSIRNNVPDEALQSSGILFVVDGDEKYIFTTADYELRLSLVGSGSGEMEYSVTQYDSETGEVTEKVFSDVALTDGKDMLSVVAGDIAVTDTQLFIKTDDTVSGEIAEDGTESDVVLISFDTGLGDPIRDLSVPTGSIAPTLPTARRDGYSFLGWYKDNALTEPFDPETVTERPMTLYAAYEETYEIYGSFLRISYDGIKLTAKLAFDYHDCSTNLFVALYRDGRMVTCESTSIPDDSLFADVSLPVTDLNGIYQLKAFFISDTGSCIPLSECADVSFYAD